MIHLAEMSMKHQPSEPDSTTVSHAVAKNLAGENRASHKDSPKLLEAC